MPSSLSYSRKFIILKRELSTVRRNNIKGHCKIERKGPKVLLTVNVENGDVESIYNVALFSGSKENPITVLGKLFTDEVGKGKGEYALNEKELGGNNSKANGIIIMSDEDILLGGYIDKEDGSIEKYINSLALESKIEETEEIKEVKPVNEFDEEEAKLAEEIQEEPAEIAEIKEVKPMETVSMEESNHENIPAEPAYVEDSNVIENIAQEDEHTPHLEPVEAEGIEFKEESSFEETLPEAVEESAPYEEYYSIEAQEATSKAKEISHDDFTEPDYKTLDYLKRLNQKNQTVNYVLSILRFFPYAEPFKYNLKGYNWWLVDLDSVNEYKAFLPYFAHVVGGNIKEYYDSGVTTCTQLMNKYKHYLFGLYNEGEEVKYFLYGIPGTFTVDEHPYRGANGFNTWFEGVKAPGYWIIYINPMTGKAVDLPNPMIPIT